MEKKATNRKSKKEETPQVITTGIEEPALNKVSMLIITQTRRNQNYVAHWIFEDKNYARAEMQKDIEKFKQAYLPGTYEIIKEEEDEVIICTTYTSTIMLQWTLLRNCTVEIEGKTTLLSPNRYNQTITRTDEEK
ncbi:MAG: hypothetical protein UH084_02900 [Paludibacteraceae bacterium]|nr:hypothetical protein [Paludibacteraceae bacterium]